jgi:hypothetical protein
MYLYIYLHIHTHTNIHIHESNVYVNRHTYINRLTFVQVLTPLVSNYMILIRTYAYTHINMSIYNCIYKYTYTYIHTCIQYIQRLTFVQVLTLQVSNYRILAQNLCIHYKSIFQIYCRFFYLYLLINRLEIGVKKMERNRDYDKIHEYIYVYIYIYIYRERERERERLR